MSRWLRIAVLIVVVAVIGSGISYGRFAMVAIPSGVGIAAKHLCSLHFVSGLPVDRARALYVDAFVQPLTEFLEVAADADSATLVASGLGSESTARYREGYGCTLVHDGGELQPSRPAPAVAEPDVVDVAHRDAHFDANALAGALDAVFENPEGRRNTLAVAVYHDDVLVAERYADGIDARTPLPGWSMTKSVTATLAGLAAQQDRLDPDAPGILPEWTDTDDPRAAITLDHLLRMTSGMNLVETQTGADVNSRMLFLEPDGGGFSARQPLIYEVGETFDYMSGSTVLAARAIRDATGGDLSTSYDWIEASLFDPLGMTTVHLEPDQAGTFIGSSFMLASAQDWAKLGRLYARGGDWRGPHVDAGVRRMGIRGGLLAQSPRHRPALARPARGRLLHGRVSGPVRLRGPLGARRGGTSRRHRWRLHRDRPPRPRRPRRPNLNDRPADHPRAHAVPEQRPRADIQLRDAGEWSRARPAATGARKAEQRPRVDIQLRDVGTRNGAALPQRARGRLKRPEAARASTLGQPFTFKARGGMRGCGTGAGARAEAGTKKGASRRPSRDLRIASGISLPWRGSRRRSPS
jgi:CubicO group peptidase (beta-lactamase class C family)